MLDLFVGFDGTWKLLVAEGSGNNKESRVPFVLKNSTMELGRGSTIKGCLEASVWMSLRTLVVTIATTFSKTSL
jgi:hypothetical protein